MDTTIEASIEQLRRAMRHYAMWPWSRHRREGLLIALNTVLELHTNRVVSQAAQTIAGPVETVKAQQGRLEKRLAALEKGYAAREVGS
jgi:hypothetical protein